MEKELIKLKRRPFMFPLLLPVAVIAVAMVMAVWLWEMRAATIVIVVRNAEIETGADPDPNLSLQGRERAARLARVLAKLQIDRGVDAIFASESRRTQQTVAPLAEALSLPVNVVPAAGWSSFPDRLLHDQRGKVVLVVGHADALPAFIEEIGGDAVSVSDNDYDALFALFVPQLSKARTLRLVY
jgi:broad specificity phosphatase PhoE